MIHVSSAMQGAWGVWSPKEEMSQLLMTIFAGATVGVMTVTSLGGVIIEHFGWPHMFYFSGGLTLIWAIFWYFLVFDSPSKHPTISDEGMDFMPHRTPHRIFRPISGRLSIICLTF